MSYEVEFTDEFGSWWNDLSEDEQDSVALSVRLLKQHGFVLKRPHADAIRDSDFVDMRELRCQHQGRPYRILYAFDPRRTALLLIGGDKTGRKDWYSKFVPLADSTYAQHLRELEVEASHARLAVDGRRRDGKKLQGATGQNEP